MSDLLLPDRIGRLLPPDTLQRVQGLLVVAYSVTELQADDEAELADSIARIIDDAVSYRRVPAPYGDLLEVAARAVLRILGAAAAAGLLLGQPAGPADPAAARRLQIEQLRQTREGQ